MLFFDNGVFGFQKRGIKSDNALKVLVAFIQDSFDFGLVDRCGAVTVEMLFNELEKVLALFGCLGLFCCGC